jgi:hypothetical protein
MNKFENIDICYTKKSVIDSFDTASPPDRVKTFIIIIR